MALINEVALDSMPTIMEVLNSYHARHLRAAIKALARTQASGVVNAGDLTVTANPTPDMAAYVGPGSAVVMGGQTPTSQGAYIGEVFSQKRVPWPAAHGTLPRIDLLAMGIYDQDYFGSRYTGVLGVVQGVAASSPVAPALPTDGNFYTLAQVLVPAAATTIGGAGGGVITNVSGLLWLGIGRAPAYPLDIAGEIRGSALRASGVANLGSPRSGRYVGAWTTTGPPTGLTAEVADYGLDGNGTLWVCTVAGTPGTWKTATNVFKARARNNANQTITTTAGKISLATEDYDPNSNFDNVTNFRYTAPITGYYLVIGRVTAFSAGSVQDINCLIYKNGAEILRQTIPYANSPSPSSPSSIVTDIVALNAGDYLELWASTNAGTFQAFSATFPAYLAVHYLSA